MKEPLEQSNSHVDETAAINERCSLLAMQCYKRYRNAMGIAAVLLCAFRTASPVAAASAVVIATDPRTAKESWAFWKGVESESVAKNQAIRVSKAMGGINPRVIGSTSKRGWGAIIVFFAADKKTRFTLSLAASTQRQAVRDALQKAKTAGGRYARVLKTWNDSKSTDDIIKL